MPGQWSASQRREYPGMYWDEDRQRYFPLSSKPKIPPAPETTESRPTRPMPHRDPSSRKCSTSGNFGRLERAKAGSSYAERDLVMHELVKTRIEYSCNKVGEYVPLWVQGGTISSFRVSDIGPLRHIVAGDSRGWLYSHYHSIDDNVPVPRQTYNEEWFPEFNIKTEITNVLIDGTRCVATSFGPASKIVVKDLAMTEMFMLSPGDHVVHDVWSGSLRDRSLVLGMRKKAVHLKDLDNSRQFESLDTQSDVLSNYQRPDSVYCGCRNGSVKAFDLRAGGFGRDILESKFREKSTSVTYLNVVQEWQLLTCTIGGDLEMFDLRFPTSRTPMMTFTGHVNSYTPKLGIAVNPSEDFLFAAGQDARIRAWSLRTGAQLQLPKNTKTDITIASTFPAPIHELQVTEERNGMRVWVGSGGYLHTFDLGPGPEAGETT